VIKLFSDDNWLLDKVLNLMAQQGLRLSNNSDPKSFLNISFKNSLDIIDVRCGKEIIKFNKPVNFFEMYSKIVHLSLEVCIEFHELKYFPFKSCISNHSSKTYLGEKHNSILSLLLIYENKGINKFDLYKNIWPEDVEIQINKLDTHLTNLKKLLDTELNYNLKSKSVKNNLKLIID